MGLEVFDFIDDLNPSFPFGNDDVSEGDDHIRGVKLTLQNAFPSNDGPGSFPGMDFFLRDLDARTISVSDEIQANPQVAIAVTTIDGLTGNITGPNFGVNGSVRTGVGSYEIQLIEQAWTDISDLQAALNAQFGLVFGVAFMHTSQVNTGPGWIGISTHALSNNQPGDTDDCGLLHFAIFDSGRD